MHESHIHHRLETKCSISVVIKKMKFMKVISGLITVWLPHLHMSFTKTEAVSGLNIVHVIRGSQRFTVKMS